MRDLPRCAQGPLEVIEQVQPLAVELHRDHDGERLAERLRVHQRNVGLMFLSAIVRHLFHAVAGVNTNGRNYTYFVCLRSG
ncbi:hypothetical protein AJ88_28810 [Mesorhizobium amorphae CCBAU 01583]|nr:hypothetical protein AJ88_28810 [Mesorhizobium amorphae CCBAU 01583]